RLTHPRLPIIMFSHLTQRGAVTTLDSMFHGATDYVSKPTYTSGPDAAREQVRAQLIPKILAFGSESAPRPQGPAPRPAAPPARPLPPPRSAPASTREVAV